MFRPARFEQLESRLLLAADGPATGMIAGGVFLLDDGPSQTPLEGVSLTLRNEVGLPVAVAATDSAGAYVFNQLAPGLYAVQQSQPIGLADRGVALGAGGGQLLADNLIGEILVASGSHLSGYNFFEGPQGPIDGGELPPLVPHGGDAVQNPLGDDAVQNAFWQLRLPNSMPAPSGETLAALPAYGRASSGLPIVELGGPATQNAQASLDSVDIATRVARRRVADDANVLETAISATGSELLLDGAVKAARWLESVWDDFSTWLPVRPAEHEAAAEPADGTPLVAEQRPPASTHTPSDETPPDVSAHIDAHRQTHVDADEQAYDEAHAEAHAQTPGEASLEEAVEDVARGQDARLAAVRRP